MKDVSIPRRTDDPGRGSSDGRGRSDTRIPPCDLFRDRSQERSSEMQPPLASIPEAGEKWKEPAKRDTNASKMPAYPFDLDVTFRALWKGVNLAGYAEAMRDVTAKGAVMDEVHAQINDLYDQGTDYIEAETTIMNQLPPDRLEAYRREQAAQQQQERQQQQETAVMEWTPTYAPAWENPPTSAAGSSERPDAPGHGYSLEELKQGLIDKWKESVAQWIRDHGGLTHKEVRELRLMLKMKYTGKSYTTGTWNYDREYDREYKGIGNLEKTHVASMRSPEHGKRGAEDRKERRKFSGGGEQW